MNQKASIWHRTRLLLHTYSYTPPPTHLVLHTFSYTPTLTRLQAAAEACTSFMEIQEEAVKARAAAQSRVLADFAMAEAKVEAAERAARDRAAALEAQERAFFEMMRKFLMRMADNV